MSAGEPVVNRGGRRLIWILGGIAVVVLIPVLILAWLGFVPGVSSLLGSNQPKDLGVQYTPSDEQNVESKSGIRFEDISAAPDHPTKPGKKLIFADPKPIAARFSQEELSALLNSASLAWLPLKEVQVKLSDRTVEISGLLSSERLPGFLKMAASLGLKESDLARIGGYAEKLADQVPVYIKAEGGVEKSELHLDLQQFAVGRLNVPSDVLAKIAPGGVHKTLRGSDQFAIQTATPREGALDFTGTLPTTIYSKTD